MSDAFNPFAALVSDKDSSSEDIRRSSNTIENVFGFTLSKNKRNRLVYLEELSKTFDTQELNAELLEHALFERVVTPNPQELTESTESEITENRIVHYLFGCFKKAQAVKEAETRQIFEGLIMRNAVTSLRQPELFEGQDLNGQMYEVLKGDLLAHKFFIDTYQQFLKDNDGAEAMKVPFTNILEAIHIDVARASVVAFPMVVFDILNIYSTDELLATILLDYCQPKKADVGAEYANTLFGAIFCCSALPKTANGSFEFFQTPLDQASNASTEGILWSSHARLFRSMHTLVISLLRCSKVIRSRILSWLGNCLKANADKGKLWNAQAPDFNPSNFTTVSDGFLVNFIALLIRLCNPFCSNVDDGKVLKVDPTYCAVPNEDCERKGIHLLDMSKETCLIPAADSDQVSTSRPTSSEYNFVTECFYMAHRAFNLGFRGTVDKLVHLNQEMTRLERAYHELLSEGGPMLEIVDNIKHRLSSELSKFLTLKCALSEPQLLEGLFDLMATTAHWLNQVSMNVDHDDSHTTFVPLKLKTVTFPLPSKVPQTLKCIPEFVIENVVCFLIFLRRFNPKMFEERGYGYMKPVLTFILVYMGSSKRTKNPHLRAHLAEALEALLPYQKDEPVGLNTLGGAQRELLFTSHEHRKEIVAALLNVFVGIEMTGESVQFEQKFNYRRPMYMVMEYIWGKEEYQQYFKMLAEAAEKNMETNTPPLFLRFVNLLINDAIFLLDESLTNMAKLREMQTIRERGEWDELPMQERAQNMGYMQHVGMLARFDNILGRDTIKTLECLTSRITIVFTHGAMVDRVAAMLNYFLLNLVGPNQKNFKVKDQKEYSFDPAVTVLDICKIYVNLRESDAFCLAVSRDGRCYSPQLFALAEDVLVRIGGGPLVGELQEVANRVSQKVAENQSSEEVAAGAPDHFLDPIMSTLMTDPVTLPSSKQIVDRSTIARHLLSDQTDPFNRAPLSMDQVIPNTELASEIQQWLEERRTKR